MMPRRFGSRAQEEDGAYGAGFPAVRARRVRLSAEASRAESQAAQLRQLGALRARAAAELATMEEGDRDARWMDMAFMLEGGRGPEGAPGRPPRDGASAPENQRELAYRVPGHEGLAAYEHMQAAAVRASRRTYGAPSPPPAAQAVLAELTRRGATVLSHRPSDRAGFEVPGMFRDGEETDDSGGDDSGEDPSAFEDPCPVGADGWHILDGADAPAAALHAVDLDLRDCPQFPRPQPCALLRPGAQFAGHQSVIRAGCPSEDWAVVVAVDQCDWGRGYVCGTMTAENVPHASAPVSTFFEGEIIGAGSHTFRTEDWGADRESDALHWSKFTAFKRIQRQQPARSRRARQQPPEAQPRTSRASDRPSPGDHLGRLLSTLAGRHPMQAGPIQIGPVNIVPPVGSQPAATPAPGGTAALSTPPAPVSAPAPGSALAPVSAPAAPEADAPPATPADTPTVAAVGASDSDSPAAEVNGAATTTADDGPRASAVGSAGASAGAGASLATPAGATALTPADTRRHAEARRTVERHQAGGPNETSAPASMAAAGPEPAGAALPGAPEPAAEAAHADGVRAQRENPVLEVPSELPEPEGSGADQPVSPSWPAWLEMDDDFPPLSAAADRLLDQLHEVGDPDSYRELPRRREAEGPSQTAARVAAPRPPAAAAVPDVIFLRIKEKAFLAQDDERSGLTIAGFYYCCITMGAGGEASLVGYYFDTHSQPFQRLALRSVPQGNHGFSSSSYQFR